MSTACGDPARALVLARCLPPGDERERRCRRLLGRLDRGAKPPLDLAPGSDGAFVPSGVLPPRLRVGAGLPALEHLGRSHSAGEPALVCPTWACTCYLRGGNREE